MRPGASKSSLGPVQQTFSLIPELPSALHSGEDGRVSRPPMTTKQAKKAYKAKNKEPKLSKAEQRRQDLMEQDRIRRELEKERNQARTKTARDKRKEKEEKEKSDKKKKGLPLVEVHPSQDTLARFMRQPPPPANPQQKPDSTIKSHNRKEGPRKTEPAPSVVQQYICDSDKTSPAGDEVERPSKRLRTGSSAKGPSTLGHPPQDMFKKPSKQQHALAGMPTDALVIPVEKKTFRSSDFDLDDPSTEQMINHQILSESFSADDGLFDDIDMDSIDVKPPALDIGHTVKKTTPLKPPDAQQKSRDRKDSFQVEATINSKATSGNVRYMKLKTPTVPAETGESPRSSDVCQGCDGAGTDKTTNGIQHSGSPSSKQSTGSCLVDSHMKSPNYLNAGTQSQAQPFIQTKTRGCTTVPATANSPALPPNASNTSHSSSEIPKTPRGLAHLTEQQSRKSMQENSSDHVGLKPTVNTQKESINANEQTMPANKKWQPAFWKPRIPFSKTHSTHPPNTSVMGPPPVPPKFKAIAQLDSEDNNRKPRFLPQQPPQDSKSISQLKSPSRFEEHSVESFPSSTQLFLLSSADELFPSPSQEVAELLESHNKSQRASLRPKTAPLPPRFMPPSRRDRPRSATGTYRAMASRGVAQMNTYIKEMTTYKNQEAVSASHMAPLVQPTAGEVQDINFMSFLSTQDVLLSSQDIIELEEETSTPAVSSERTCNPVMVRHMQTADPSTHRPMQHIENQSPSTPAQISHTGRMQIVPLSNSAQTAKPSNTQIRILGPYYDSQQSSSPPATPSVAPRKSGSSYSKTCTVISSKMEHVNDKENIPPEYCLIDDETAAELLVADLDMEDDKAERMQRKVELKIVDRPTPIAVQPSPKPFFTSSGTKEKVYLAIEKSKITPWKNTQTHRKAEESLHTLLRHEEEKQERVLLERMLEAEENEAQQPDTTLSVSPDTAQERCEPSSRGQKSSAGSENSRRRSQPQSSFEKMLQMLEKSKSDQMLGSASQDSDYGEIMWDMDDFTGL